MNLAVTKRRLIIFIFMGFDPGEFSQPDKISDEADFHFFHHAAAVNLDGLFGCAEVPRNFLITMASYDVPEDFSFAWG